MPVERSGWFSTLLHRKIAGAGAGLMLLLAFTLLAPPSTPGPPERDFEAYDAAGVTVNAGRDPYSRAIWTVERTIPGVTAGRDELLPFVGPAAALPFWSVLGRLPYRLALGCWTALLIAAVLVIIASALRLARVRVDVGRAGFAGAFAIASAPLIGSLALGQAALVAAAGIAAALVTYRARIPGLALGATLAAAIQPNLTLVLIARIRSRWDVAVAAGAAASFGLLGSIAGGGLPGWRRYLARLAAHGNAERFIAIQHTPSAIFYALGFAPHTALVMGALIALTALAGTVILIVRERLDPTAATLLACAAVPLAAPFFHQPDFVLEVLPILILALRATGRARTLASIAAALVLVDWFGLAQRHGAQAQIVSLGLALCFAFIGAGSAATRGNRRVFAGLATLLAIAAIAIPLGRSHPAPTWPDRLPLTFAADPAADVSDVWAQEQRAAGLAAADPVWGALRALPLAGCVVLAVALIVDTRRRRRMLLNIDPEHIIEGRRAIRLPAAQIGIIREDVVADP